MAIQSNFGNIKPSLNLDFANTKKLDSRITFTRASTATYYDGVTTAKAEENLLLQSQTFNTTWALVGSTVTADTSVAPDGVTTADTLTENPSGTGQAAASQAVSFTAGLPYTFSIFVKQGTQTFVQLLFGAGAFGSNAYANFNVTTGAGAVGTVGASTTASIVDAGNGWYRCIITATATTTASVNAQLNIVESATDARAPSITLDSGTILLWGAQLEQRSSVTSYTATTTQPITNYIPVLLTAANNVPRFDHNPTTAESLGLLIEEQRTNTILQSEDLDTTWAETRATLNLNSVVSPGGTLTADRLIASTDNNTHFTTQTFTGTAASWTFTAYAKASGLNFVALRLFNGTSQVGLAYYNLSTGATGTVTAGTAAITAVGNGWYRCSLTATLAASASCTADIYLASADNTNSFAGDAFNGIALWGFQVELGAFPTSYIATGAATATRSADSASMTGTNFSSWVNNAGGTLYVEYINYTTATGSLFSFDDGTANNRLIAFTNLGITPAYRVVVGGVDQALAGLANITVGTVGKMSFGYQVNNFAGSANGAAVVTDLSGTLPTSLAVARIGVNVSGAAALNGTIKRIAYYPVRLQNSQLQALTS